MKRTTHKKTVCMVLASVFCLSLISCSDKKQTNPSVYYESEQSVQTNEIGEQVIDFLLVGTNPNEYSSAVKRFNEQYKGKYSIAMRQIENTKDTEDFSNALHLEIVSGNAPDIICAFDYSLFHDLSAKDAFTDMYPLIDSENSSLAREDFFSNLLAANEVEEKLVAMPSCFGVSTAVAKKKNVPGVSENWTPEQMVEALENMPEDTLLSVGASDPVVNLFNLVSRSTSKYIDYSTGECTFDGEEFTRLIELSKELTTRGDSMYEDELNAFATDKALVYFASVMSEEVFESMKKDTFADDELIFAGNPTYNGKGGGFVYADIFGITETSECKEASWLFLEEILGDKHYKDIAVQGFSPLEKNLNIEDEYLDSYIRSITDTDFYDDSVMSIIQEEAEYYYNGERTAQECTEIINNRVSIKIAEQTWQT